MNIDIYVPTPEAWAAGGVLSGILDRSGIVGKRTRPTETLIYFEGNKYGFVNVHTWADKVRVAAHRLITTYPTIARRCVPPAAVVKVGELTVLRSTVRMLLVTDQDTLSAWLDDPVDLDRELMLS